MKTVKANLLALIQIIYYCLIWLSRKCIKMQLRFDRKVLKRYFGIETPLYRMWHTKHVKTMQRKLDHEAKMRKGYELGYIF